jgi:hypothetical protein
VSVWFETDVAGNFSGSEIVVKRYTTLEPYAQWSIEVKAQVIHCAFNHAGAFTTVSGTTDIVGTGIHNVTLTWSNRVMSVYIDGQPEFSKTLDNPPHVNTDPVFFGGWYQKFNGLVFSCTIYGRPFSAADVSAMFDDEKTRYGL